MEADGTAVRLLYVNPVIVTIGTSGWWEGSNKCQGGGAGNTEAP